MIELIPDYYVRFEQDSLYRSFYEPGQFFWIPASYLVDANPAQGIQAAYRPDGMSLEFYLEEVGWSQFGEQRSPIKELELRADERLLAVRAKRRPALLMSDPNSSWEDRRRNGEDSFLMAPIYSFRGDETKREFSPDFVERVKAYVYNTHFYLPPHEHPRFVEGFVRFDRLQMVHKAWLDHMAMRLNEDALACLRHWLFYYLGGDLQQIDDVLFMYREEKMKTLGLGR